MKSRLSKNDPSSFAQPDVSVVRRMHLTLDVDFQLKILSGLVELQIERIQKEINELVLDVKDLKISSVVDVVGKGMLDYKITDNVPEFGSKLTVYLPEDVDNNNVKICIKYETAPHASGLQWLEPNQTSDKTHPFLFSQCQAIHARSIVPCQDTPAVKAPYTAQISSPDGMTVLMSAIKTGEEKATSGKTIFTFEQKVCVPSYLLALCVGRLASSELGTRSRVWAEPSVVESAAYEFGETERMLAVAEELCGPYVWGRYDLLVLPPSFPFGGMENPCLTFVTPTLLAGDRSLALVVAHEIAHSWTGNLVTNRNFEHFWLNEGFTVFVERKIAGAMCGGGESRRDFETLGGLATLAEAVDKLGADSPLTQLVPDLSGPVHPDDSFSAVPYEKGQLLLRRLERAVGGPARFEPFLRHYLDKYKYRSVDTDDFRREFETYFEGARDAVDWERWLYGRSMPPSEDVTELRLDRALVGACERLRDLWLADDACSARFKRDDLAELTSNQLVHFLQLLLDEGTMTTAKLELMERLYELGKVRNAEVRFRWIRLGLRARWTARVQDALDMVTEVGRMKYVRPIYRDLYAWEQMRPAAIDTFKRNRKDMMHVTAYTVAKDLHLDTD